MDNWHRNSTSHVTNLRYDSHATHNFNPWRSGKFTTTCLSERFKLTLPQHGESQCTGERDHQLHSQHTAGWGKHSRKQVTLSEPCSGLWCCFVIKSTDAALCIMVSHRQHVWGWGRSCSLQRWRRESVRRGRKQQTVADQLERGRARFRATAGESARPLLLSDDVRTAAAVCEHIL